MDGDVDGDVDGVSGGRTQLLSVLWTSGTYWDFSGTLFLPRQIPEKSHQEMKSQKTPTYGYTFAILRSQD